MGSFNTTCMASQQTIAPGDNCYVLPISKAPWQDLNYPHGFWTPVGNFLSGTYADYGRVMLDETAINSARLLQFAQTLYDTEAGVGANFKELIDQQMPALAGALSNSEATADGLALFPELAALWEAYEFAAQEFNAFIDTEGRPLALTHAVFHQCAYEKLLARSNELVDWSGQSLAQRAVFDRALALIKEMSSPLRSMARDARLFDMELSAVGRFEGLRIAGSVEAYRILLRQFGQKALDEEELFEAVKPWMDSWYVMAALGLYNLRLSPMVYAGQDSTNEAGRAYAQFVQEVARDITADMAY